MTFGCAPLERKLLFFPSHHPNSPDGPFTPWIQNGLTIGFAKTNSSPKNIWLMFHGNGGQASDRTYALPHFSPDDSVYVMEYPGYGKRPGVPTFQSVRSTAIEAYQLLRQTFPKTPICIVSESFGCGPASLLANQNPPPDKIVLIVPFDSLAVAAKDHFPSFIVWLLLTHKWDNIESLSHYKGPVQIFAAANDTIIRPQHARALADSLTNATFTLIDGEHNDWSNHDQVRIHNP